MGRPLFPFGRYSVQLQAEESRSMGSSVYNPAIRHRSNLQRSDLHSGNPRLMTCFFPSGRGIAVILAVVFLLLGFPISTRAADWNESEQQLAQKIVAVIGPGAVAWTVENRSSLGRRDVDVIMNGLCAALETAGVRIVNTEQAAAELAVILSENPGSYVWVAQIQQGASDATVVMVSIPRAEGAIVAKDSVPLTLRKTKLFSQPDPILDVAVLEENVTPTRIAVLDPEKIALYRLRGGDWQQEQSMPLNHTRPWPRDVRGRLFPAKDHLLDAYLPGLLCHSTTRPLLSMDCHESDDPWPLVPDSLSGGAARGMSPIARMAAFFAPARNFFTGALVPGVGKFTTTPKFYSAAFVPRDKYVLWLFAAVEGQVHMVDGVSDTAAKLGWGSDLASLKTSCGAGWQVLAASAGEQAGDSVRAYEFPDRNAIPVSAAADLSGRVTALWTEARGDTAVVVVRDRETRAYEAFRLAVVCNQ